ncbi:MAG: DUF1648 domain-containing protein [Bryobacteraceae bacterium]
MRFLREALALAGLALQIVVVWVSWNTLPDRVPTHYGFSGRADAYGGKSSLIVLPAVSVGLYLLVTVVSFFSRLFNYPVVVTDKNRDRLEAITVAMVGWIKVEMMWSFAYISWAIVREAHGVSGGLGWAFLPLMLGAIGATIAIAVVEVARAG